MRKFVLALALSAAFATPAMAEDFAGPYVGLGVTLDNVQGSGDAEGLGVSGIGATAIAGYDIALGANSFVGLEANADLNTADYDDGVDELEADWGWGVGARVGYKLNASTALYVRGGYARSRVSLNDVNAWGDGVRYGLGLQTALTDKVSLRAEFSQFNYEQHVINNQGALSLSYGF
jgi:outer membrane immunogenic protein